MNVLRESDIPVKRKHPLFHFTKADVPRGTSIKTTISVGITSLR